MGLAFFAGWNSCRDALSRGVEELQPIAADSPSCRGLDCGVKRALDVGGGIDARHLRPGHLAERDGVPFQLVAAGDPVTPVRPRHASALEQQMRFPLLIICAVSVLVGTTAG